MQAMAFLASIGLRTAARSAASTNFRSSAEQTPMFLSTSTTCAIESSSLKNELRDGYVTHPSIHDFKRGQNINYCLVDNRLWITLHSTITMLL